MTAPGESGTPSDEPIEVEVVRAQAAHFPDLTPFHESLSEDERSRVLGYKITESRNIFILARGLLRAELAKRLGVASRDIRFDVRASGKPDLRPTHPSRPDWRFSVSHTGSHVAIAFVRGADVGVDIERVDRAVNPLEIAKRYFTAQELHSLQGRSEESRRRAFFAGWTRKEAIVKARGQTMAESLTTLTVDLDPAATHPGYDDQVVPERPLCRLAAFEFPEDHLMGAVSLVSPRPPRLRFDVLSGARFD